MNRTQLSKLIQKTAYLFPFVLFACALYVVHNELKIHNIHDILLALQATPLNLLLAAVALTIVNYLVLAAYDWLALRFTRHAGIPLPKMIAAALLSYAISNNTGHAWAAGGSIRYRFYSKWGVPGWDILKISLFQTVTYLLGALTLGLLGSLLLPYFLPHALPKSQVLNWVSGICTFALLIYWGAVLLWHKPLRVKGFELHLPTCGMTAAQTVVSCLDIVLSSLVFWVLLLGKLKLGFETFLVVFVVAQVVGVISQVPGGIGVFESAFLWLMSGVAGTDQHLFLISALLLYRAIYYFAPLLLAGIGLLSTEIYGKRQIFIEGSKAANRLMPSIVPPLYSLLLLFAGAILLISGAIPANPKLMLWLRDLVPLPLVEFSHLTGSLVGLLLIFLSRGIRLKINAAWYGSLLLLGLGIVVSLLKGFDWREALLLSVILLLLLPTRSHFQRHSSLLQMPLSRYWLTITLMILGSSVWLGFFSHRSVPYAHELWWQFTYEADAPRFLRALLLMSLVIGAYLLSRLFSIAKPCPITLPSSQELTEAAQLLALSDDTQGFLALLGDKTLFWNESRSAFIMFTMTTNYWVAIGNPIGEAAAFESILWEFREQADRYGANPVFYQVNESLLPCYLDLGLSLFKLGEEAKVELSAFSLQGKKGEAYRSAINKMTKLNYRFEILSGNQVPQVLPVLRQVSDAWLRGKHTREKRFSLGFFDEAYLKLTPIAVVRNEQGQIKAFANLWQTASKHELSIDLMRYQPDSPKGIMDYLFAQLMLWAQAEQYQWFSLGVAPLAGLENRPLAPLWHKIGNVIFDFGGDFYNFEGLYEYKAKFAPQWQPRYLAAQAGLSVPLILLTIARLIAGGWKGMFAK